MFYGDLSPSPQGGENCSLLRLLSPHGRCAACGLSRPAGTCTGPGHTGPCRSRGCSTCSRRDHVMCGPEGVRRAQPVPFTPNLCLDSHRCVTLMGLGAEESGRPPVPLKSPPSLSSWSSGASGQCRLVRLRGWDASSRLIWCTWPSTSMATERMERLRA